MCSEADSKFLKDMVDKPTQDEIKQVYVNKYELEREQRGFRGRRRGRLRVISSVNGRNVHLQKLDVTTINQSVIGASSVVDNVEYFTLIYINHRTFNCCICQCKDIERIFLE